MRGFTKLFWRIFHIIVPMWLSTRLIYVYVKDEHTIAFNIPPHRDAVVAIITNDDGMIKVWINDVRIPWRITT